ncbi:hypothetical protein AAHC03_026607 [Spirometra sp. Aus1]
MGSKTAYVNNGLVSYRALTKTGERLVHMNLLFRHGTRSPEEAFLKRMGKWTRQLKSRKELSDFNFTFNCGASESKKLLPVGVQELEDLGLRWRRRVSLRFRQPTNAQVYISPTNRTAESARAFVSKFFDSPMSVRYEVESERLRFFETCARYRQTIRKNKTLLTEWYAFQRGPEMKRVLDEVVADNGLYDLNITLDDLDDFYKMASHEASVMGVDDVVSGWLRLFRPEHLYVLEYLHDLKHYWTKANPFPINYEQVCPLWGSIMEQMLHSAKFDMRLDACQECAKPPLGVFWFGHAETLLPLVIKLGLFNESVKTHLGGGDHLRSSGLQSRLDRLMSRPPVANLFRTAHISPFAGNIAFLLFHRPRPRQAPSLDDYILEVLLNEQVVDILPHIPRDELTLRRVLEHFSSCRLQEHDHNSLCALPDGESLSSAAQRNEL